MSNERGSVCEGDVEGCTTKYGVVIYDGGGRTSPGQGAREHIPIQLGIGCLSKGSKSVLHCFIFLSCIFISTYNCHA